MRTWGTVLLIGASALVSACDNSRSRGGGRFIPPTFKDASTSACSGNPNNCVEHQLLAGDCSCLPACEPGFAWNGSACSALDPGDAGSADTDGGDPPIRNDAGGSSDGGAGVPDSGVPTDSGTPQNPGCMVNTDCPGPGATCIDPNTLQYCNGRQGCSCAQSCDPYASTNSCSSGVCTWLGAPDPNRELGLCFQDQGGGTQGQTCNTQYDAQGNVTQDSCNRTRNSICWGATPQNPFGVCTTICGTNNPSVCSNLGSYICDDLGAPQRGFGVCLQPPPSFTDIGNSCTSPASCQGGFCSQTLASSCSAMCGGLANCPNGSFCLDLQTEGPSCALGCNHNGTTGDDTFCRGRNPNTVCENLGTTTPIGICVPACTDSSQCGGGQCVNGHCQ